MSNNIELIEQNNINNIEEKINDIHKKLDIVTKKNNCYFCYTGSFENNIIDVINILEFKKNELYKKKILLNRYVELIKTYKKRRNITGLFYYLLKVINQICSILTPAILSIQHFGGENIQNNPLYWSSWIISIIVGLITNFIAMFDLDKTYFSTSITLAQLKIEGWEYFELSGKYSENDYFGNEPTHDNKFKLFFNEIEKIKKTHIKSVYNPNNKNNNNNNNNNKNNNNNIDTNNEIISIINDHDSESKISLQRENSLHVVDINIIKNIFNYYLLDIYINNSNYKFDLNNKDYIKNKNDKDKYFDSLENNKNYIKNKNKKLYYIILEKIDSLIIKCKHYDKNKLNDKNISKINNDRYEYIQRLIDNIIEYIQDTFDFTN
jgi:hypothetical protein